MNNGFIKLFRCVEDSFFWNDSEAVHLWIQLLLSANHKEREMLLSGKKIIIRSGQFMCSRLTLSAKTGINESKIQRLLKVFESEQMIEQQMNSKYRIISISNWSKYQGSEQIIEQQVNSKRTADEQQMNTNNNDKNLKNDKNKTKTDSKPDGLLDVYFEFIILGIEPQKAKTKAIDFYSHYNSNGWKVGKNAMKSWKSACAGTWMKDCIRSSDFEKDHLKSIVELLKDVYKEQKELDNYDIQKAKQINPLLFEDPFQFPDCWQSTLGGLK